MKKRRADGQTGRRAEPRGARLPVRPSARLVTMLLAAGAVIDDDVGVDGAYFDFEPVQLLARCQSERSQL